MKKIYITVNEVDGGHIGTIGASNGEELKNKLNEASTSHFDEVVDFTGIDFDGVFHQLNTSLCSVVCYVKTEDGLTPSIRMELTWLY